MQARQRDLGRTGEIEPVRGELVDVCLVGGKRARADQRLLADEDRRQHGDEPLRGESVERQAVEREREQRRVAHPVAEAGARHPCGALHLEAPDLGVLARLVECRGLADPAHLGDVVLGRSVGDVRMRQVGDAQREPVALGLGGRELLLGSAQLFLHLLHLRELLRRGLALQLRLAAQLVDLRHERPPALVRLEQRVEGLGGALAGKRGAVAVGVVARCLEVDHARESRKASIACATPSSSGPGQIQSASSFRTSAPFSTQTP